MSPFKRRCFAPGGAWSVSESCASVRTWLYRIATNVCFDAWKDRARRERSVETEPAGIVSDRLAERHRALPNEAAAGGDPAELATLRESIRLAFLAALQHLPPKQRGVLLLAEVVGWSAAEIAGSLGTSIAAVYSALQRARRTLSTKDLGAAARAPERGQSWLLERYVAAFERHGCDELTHLLCEEATPFGKQRPWSERPFLRFAHPGELREP